MIQQKKAVPLLEDASILSHEEINTGYFRLRLSSPGMARAIIPGQFVMLRVDDRMDPILRRPFSVFRILSTHSPPFLEILYQVVGRGTRLLSLLPVGERVSLLGPLGNGFPIKEHKEVVLAAGGMGVAPLFALGEAIVKRAPNRTGTVFIGGKEKGDVVCAEEFEDIGFDVVITTEDGSLGKKGLVTRPLEKIMKALSENEARNTVLYACGPAGMLSSLARSAMARGIECYVSLEEKMACGVGACLGCVAPVITKESPSKGEPRSSYRCVCTEGPVFAAGEIQW